MKKLICVLLWVIFVVLILSGCKSTPVVIAPPALAQCNQMCYTPCVKENGDTGVVWEVTGTQANDWDELGDTVTSMLSAKLRQCELNRQACTKCLDRLETENVIKQ